MTRKMITTPCCDYSQVTEKEPGDLIACTKCKKYHLLTKEMLA